MMRLIPTWQTKRLTLVALVAAATETIRQNPDQLQRFSRSFRNKAAFPDPNGQGNLIYSAGEWWWIDP
jgi:hypothetical protein